jgi:hypothetical protein
MWMGLVAVLAGSAAATEAKLQTDVFSAFVWRGITVSENPVIQPALDVALPSGFDLTLWGNLDLGDNHGEFSSGEFSETDLILSYGYTTGAVSLTVGYIEYLYPHQTSEATTSGTNEVALPGARNGGALPGTREIYIGFDVDLGLGFAASTYLYNDVDEVKDFYANGGVTYSYECAAMVTTELGASVGFAGKDWAAYNSGGTDGGFHEYTVTLGVRYPIPASSMEIGAQVAYTDSLDTDVLPDPETHMYGGCSLACEF